MKSQPLQAAWQSYSVLALTEFKAKSQPTQVSGHVCLIELRFESQALQAIRQSHLAQFFIELMAKG